MYVHALLVLRQAESVCAHNERGVSEALYCIIPLYTPPEGRKRSKCSLISFYVTMCVLVKIYCIVSLAELGFRDCA